jgi:hypothetical protein
VEREARFVFRRLPNFVHPNRLFSVCHLSILIDLTTGTDVLLMDLAGFRVVILDTYQAAIDILVKSGNNALSRSFISFASMSAYELIAFKH